MRIAVFSAQEFEREGLERANKNIHKLVWLPQRLCAETAHLAAGCDLVMVFANDDVSAPVLDKLKELRVQYISTRSTGYNHIDLTYAKSIGLRVAYVPHYSPYAIAEHALALMMSLNRHLKEALCRVSKYDFSLHGLTGFDMHGATVGIVGLGAIGEAMAAILHGMGCKILGYDLIHSATLAQKYKINYVPLDTLLREADIVTLHVPLNAGTHHLIDQKALALMKPNAMLINTSRGGVVNTAHVYAALKGGKLGSFGMDVYENEGPYFFKDRSGDGDLEDKLLAELIAHPRVQVTAHQAFLTRNALRNIADTTLYNINCWDKGFRCKNELT